MSYLFGDSTPSTLAIDYIQFLRDAFDCCIDVLRADERIAQGKVHLESLEKAAAADLEQVQKVAALVPSAFDGASLGAAESPAARCAAAILRSAAALAAATVSDVKGSVELAASKGGSDAAEERRACAAALERLLIKHDLPGMKSDLQVVLVGAGHYVGRAQISTDFGVSGTLELEIPRDHLFERVVRLDRLAEKLDVQAPELGGWLHKEVKLRPQHLEKHHVVGLSVGAAGDTIRLRAGADGSGAGFDVIFGPAPGGVRLLRVDDQNKRDGEPFVVESNTDVAKLQMMREKLVAAATVLVRHRRGLVDVKIDGEPLATHPTPSLLAERLVAAMAPTVQEIASRSQSPGELVLRRLIGEARREEIFLAKQELLSKLEGLSASNRAVFDPLWVVPPPGALPLAPPKTTTTPADTTASESSSGASIARSPFVTVASAVASSAPPAVPETLDPFPSGGIIELADSAAVTVIGLPPSPATSPPVPSGSSERTNPSTSDVVEISLIEEAPTTP